MPREVKLFLSSSGSAARGFLRFRANIPPRWIKNAQKPRKQIEPEIVDALRSVKSIQRNRPRAQVALKTAKKQIKAVLSRWETAYNKENFYRGIASFLNFSAMAPRPCNRKFTSGACSRLWSFETYPISSHRRSAVTFHPQGFHACSLGSG